MFVFFSSRLGIVGSIAVSVVMTLILLVVFRVIGYLTRRADNHHSFVENDDGLVIGVHEFLGQSPVIIKLRIRQLRMHYTTSWNSGPDMQSPGVHRPDMAMNSESSAAEKSQEEPHPSAERLAYSVDEAARLTGLSRDLLYDLMRRGNLRYVKIGRRRLITRQHLEQFLGVAS
jgi:excisionase family DNA binding protein